MTDPREELYPHVAEALATSGWTVHRNGHGNWTGLASKGSALLVYRVDLDGELDGVPYAGTSCEIPWHIETAGGIWLGSYRAEHEARTVSADIVADINDALDHPYRWDCKAEGQRLGTGKRKKYRSAAPPAPFLFLYAPKKDGLSFPVLQIPVGRKGSLSFGASKARAILAHLDAIRAFVADESATDPDGEPIPI